VRQRERALPRRLDQVRAAREVVDEGQHLGALHLAPGVRDQVLQDALLGRLEDLAAHREAHVVIDDERQEARDVGHEIDAQDRLLMRVVGVARNSDPTQPSQRDFVEGDQRLVVVVNPVASELEVLDRPHQRLFQNLAPAATVPVRQVGLHAVEQLAREQAAELEHDLAQEIAQALGQALNARDRRRFVRVHLVHLANPRGRGTPGARRVVVQPVQVATQRERVEDAAPFRTPFAQDGIAQVGRHRVGATAELLQTRRLALVHEPASGEDRQARLQIVVRHVRDRLRVDEVGHAALVARRGQEDVEDRRQAPAQVAQPLHNDVRITHPVQHLLA